MKYRELKDRLRDAEDALHFAEEERRAHLSVNDRELRMLRARYDALVDYVARGEMLKPPAPIVINLTPAESDEFKKAMKPQ